MALQFSSALTALLVAALTAGMTACTYRGGDMADPITRKTEWFSYLNGDDMRQSCATGSPDRYRLVYNGRYQQQIRMYEWDSLRRVLDVKVVDQQRLGALRADDLTAPWRARTGRLPLKDGQYGQLVEALARDGISGPVAAGLSLPSTAYYWTATVCQQGQMQVTGWLYPSADFKALAFPSVLRDLDPSDVPFAVAQDDPLDPQLEDMIRRGEVTSFTLKISRDGLVR